MEISWWHRSVGARKIIDLNNSIFLPLLLLCSSRTSYSSAMTVTVVTTCTV